jgi:PIN domain nuclease of toxin-antitoxin system
LFVIDSSAVIALLRQERGWELVRDALLDANSNGSPAVISAVNLSEVIDKLGSDLPPALFEDPRPLVTAVAFTPDHARATSAMYPGTSKLGLSLADRACLSLAENLDVPALTADAAWNKVKTSIEVRQIR